MLELEAGKTTATSVNISKSGAMTDVIGTLNVSEDSYIASQLDGAADKITTLGGNAVIKGDLNTKSAGA